MSQGTVVALGPCWACKRNFLFDPDKVPSISICTGCDRPPDLHSDECSRRHEILKMPICRDCVTKGNAERAIINQPLITIPPGAYFDA